MLKHGFPKFGLFFRNARLVFIVVSAHTQLLQIFGHIACERSREWLQYCFYRTTYQSFLTNMKVYPSAWSPWPDKSENLNQHSVSKLINWTNLCLFIYLGFFVAFNTVQVISRRVVGRAEETSTYSMLGFCTVNCRPTESNPGLRGGRRECSHSATVAPELVLNS